MLTPFDDYPIHQTSQPVAHTASADLNHYDRYFFNGYAADGSLFFGAALGLYPNRQVIDGAFSVVVDGEQRSVHASGRCPAGRTPTAVGSVRVAVVEPLRRLRVVVEAPEHGLAAELTFTGRGEAVEEPPFLLRQGSRTLMDYTRLTQLGTWAGWVDVDGHRHDVDGLAGCRDRSWGIRPVGERAPGAPGPLPQFFWLWAPLSFPSFGTLFDVQEDADGRRWHHGGAVVAPDGPAEHVVGVDHRVAWEPGTRRMASAELDLLLHGGRRHTIALEPLLHFQMLGLGYLHPEWGHGVWKGELAVAGERWPVPVADPLAVQHLHVQTLVRATVDGGEVGVGVLEQLVIGPHGPSGLTGLLDGAP